eukprot:GILI01030304.1.p1 GENE.GILI01030304.1~~GILI01030304.1.p1  ORF type:complete len:127 (+),score=7.25 GILI01030304.1:563-943(+)
MWFFGDKYTGGFEIRDKASSQATQLAISETPKRKSVSGSPSPRKPELEIKFSIVTNLLKAGLRKIRPKISSNNTLCGKCHRALVIEQSPQCTGCLKYFHIGSCVQLAQVCDFTCEKCEKENKVVWW